MTQLYKLRKFLLSIFCVHRAFRRTQNPHVVMTLLVKDEADIIEANILFHKSLGIDGFIVTDNGSTDGTKYILEKYVQKGWILEVIDELASGYEQKRWVDRMIWRAKMIYHADWVINADADEFWFVPSGNFKTTLECTHANVLRCEMRSMYPEENIPFWQWKHAVRTVENQENYGLSHFSLFERQNKKVIHRTDGYLQISMGNHKVMMFPKISCDSDIRIYHYQIRGFNHFMRKMINGGKTLEQHSGRHGGRHWRYFYQLYKEGCLNEEYERVIGRNRFDDLVRDGYIFEDNTLYNYFKKKYNTMKHAYLILAHSEYLVLNVLLSMLDDQRNDVYIHVDARSDELYRQIESYQMKNAGFYLLKNRIKVYWGHSNQIRAELALLQEAFNNGSYDYYHFLSGVDLPIKSQNKINEFFEANKGYVFVGFWHGAFHEWDVNRKIGRYHFFLRYKRMKKHFLHYITSPLYNLSLSIQDIISFRRNFSQYNFKKGFFWCSLPNDFVSYILQRKKEIIQRYQFTLCGDEIYIHTLLWNSPFRERIYNLNDPERGSLRKIDFLHGNNHGNPHVWTISDFDELISSDLLFARKFSSQDMYVVREIEKSLKYGAILK